MGQSVSLSRGPSFLIRHLISQPDDMIMTGNTGLPVPELYVFAPAGIIHFISHSFKDYIFQINSTCLRMNPPAHSVSIRNTTYFCEA